jgi:hypothetical protein
LGAIIFLRIKIKSKKEEVDGVVMEAQTIKVKELFITVANLAMYVPKARIKLILAVLVVIGKKLVEALVGS